MPLVSLQAHRRLAVAALLVWGSFPSVARPADGLPPGRLVDALQVMADLALIDDTCRDAVVHWGVGFRFAAGQGLSDTTILPGGTRRREFEAVLQARQASFGPDELCGQIAHNYAEALPGSITPAFHREEERP